MMDSENSVKEFLGNTRPKTQVSPVKRWCFTLNNYDEEEIKEIVVIFKGLCKLFIIGKEVGESGTPHLQGYCEFNKSIRPLSLKVTQKIHWEKCKGNREQNVLYCSKESVFIKYGFPKEVSVIDNLKPWQAEVVKIIDEEPDDRTIHWYYDGKGGIGKSALVKLLCLKYGAVMTCGKSADMKYMIVKYNEKNGNYPSIVIIDVPRSKVGFLNYAGLEEIKNGCFCNTKYECDMVVMNSPHVLVFANEPPDYDKMSMDRWKVTEL